jgi:hypothetical protein
MVNDGLFGAAILAGFDDGKLVPPKCSSHMSREWANAVALTGLLLLLYGVDVPAGGNVE